MPRKPGFHHQTSSNQKSKWVEFDTYVQLKKELAKYIKESVEDHVTVYREKRGQWGEWFEYWYIDDNDKPYKGKEGWM